MALTLTPSLPMDIQPGAGLAVHQIITITVSLIMVIAALITTLVLKNCCAQSGRPRRNSHQRKLDQQEESCQNLTDFAPARVPSALDIFTAYNETLQCSHECVRTPVSVYAEDTLHSPGDYKTTFNGNRLESGPGKQPFTQGLTLEQARMQGKYVFLIQDQASNVFGSEGFADEGLHCPMLKITFAFVHLVT
ncbi:adherens junctions associated protein 1 [Willisornis vidua]|uniref:Adherens junctions associated protein 1 n=1 Tax=Willisornis vidua TaxID=1566151 RepID=A0ABQ9DH41_9PASS|nr:adherens junctions associated protein 1 [Willisornis vidua]